MKHPEEARETGDVALGFDRRVRLEFHRAKISSGGGLLRFRDLDDLRGLDDLAGGVLRTRGQVLIGCILWLAFCGSRLLVAWLDIRT